MRILKVARRTHERVAQRQRVEGVKSRIESELGPMLYDLLSKLIEEEPYVSLLDHPYWMEMTDGDPASQVGLTAIVGKEMEGLAQLRGGAMQALSEGARKWLDEGGGPVESKARLYDGYVVTEQE